MGGHVGAAAVPSMNDRQYVGQRSADGQRFHSFSALYANTAPAGTQPIVEAHYHHFKNALTGHRRCFQWCLQGFPSRCTRERWSQGQSSSGWSVRVTSSARRPNATVSGVEFIRMAVQVAPAEPGHMGEDLCRDRVDECPPPKVRGGWDVVVAGTPHLHLCCSEDKLGSSAGLYSEQPKQIQQLPCNEPEINICSRPFMVNPFISVSSDGFSLTECYNIQIKAYFVTSAGDCVWLRQLY